MKRRYDHVFQFKVTLKEVTPPVWRRIQVPHTYTFWDLHVAIQGAMGWLDYHLHEFEIPHPAARGTVRIGIPTEDDWDERPLLPDWDVPIAKYFTLLNRSATYVYDFGDFWQHALKLEWIMPAVKGQTYPACIGGKRARPPEDCGGPMGYEDLLKIVADSEHEDHEQTMEWLGGSFDSEKFSCDDVVFDDPDQRLDDLFRWEP